MEKRHNGIRKSSRRVQAKISSAIKLRKSRGLVGKGKNPDSDNNSSHSNNRGIGRNGEALRKPIRHFVSNIVTVISIGLILLVIIIVLAQNRSLSEEIQQQNKIQQKFLRCLVLIPPDSINTPEQRTQAVDKCVAESRLPDGSTASEPPAGTEELSIASSPEGQPETSVNKQPPPTAQPPIPSSTSQPQTITTPAQERPTVTREVLDYLHEQTESIPILRGIL